MMEGVLTCIIDMEDSVAAGDAADKVQVYKNICGVFRGTLQASVLKNGVAETRKMNEDIWFRDEQGRVKIIQGRALAIVKNVGHHMFTDSVLTADGRPVPEGFLDCLVTVAAALPDLRGMGRLY